MAYQRDVVPTAPIGIFDSGVGGLTVLRELNRQLPNESILVRGRYCETALWRSHPG